QYCPLCQRLLMPMALPLLNCSGRETVRGMTGSLMGASRSRGAGRVRTVALLYRTGPLLPPSRAARRPVGGPVPPGAVDAADQPRPEVALAHGDARRRQPE